MGTLSVRAVSPEERREPRETSLELSLQLDPHQQTPLVTSSCPRSTPTPPQTPLAPLGTQPTPLELLPLSIQQQSGSPLPVTWTLMRLQPSQQTLSIHSRPEPLTWALKEPTSLALALRHPSSHQRPHLRTQALRTGTRSPSSLSLNSRHSTTVPCLRNTSPRPLQFLKLLLSLMSLRMPRR